MKRRIGIVGDGLSETQLQKFLEVVWGARDHRDVVIYADDKTGESARHHCECLGVPSVKHSQNPVYGKVATEIRNKALINDSYELHAFWDGTSPGTADAIKQARMAGMTVKVYKP